MIPIKQYYTEEVKENYWSRIDNLLSFENKKKIEKLIATDPRFARFKDTKGLVLADFNDLKRCIKSLKSSKPSGFDFMIKRYKKFVADKSLYNNINLVDDLGIDVCPYCNRSFIHTTIIGKKRKPKATSQLDHFFDKGTYPYFALSLFNLIPVCSSCNHSKLSKEFKKSPFEIEDVDKGFTFSLEYTKADYTKPDAFRVITKTPDEGLDDQRIILGLEKLYEKHNDVAHELFLKQHIYSEDRIIELCESFPDLFTSPNEVRQLVLGNYIDKNDVGKRPLAKMTRDIMKQLGFIEE